MEIPILRLPTPNERSVIVLVSNIAGAQTNPMNEQWTDIFMTSGFIDPLTIDMTIDVFFAAWLMMLKDEDFSDGISEPASSEMH